MKVGVDTCGSWFQQAKHLGFNVERLDDPNKAKDLVLNAAAVQRFPNCEAVCSICKRQLNPAPGYAKEVERAFSTYNVAVFKEASGLRVVPQ